MARREKVKRVIDGDTFVTESRKNPVRLANVDAPEKGEPGAATAKRRLEGLIKDKTVSIETVARDSYGRSVATVKVKGISVNRAMRPKRRK
ncbi:MAG TPA: thermonuclease family protein [Phycisphaerae bacterium]|nr:thermonuclease family protein [Phycisphaerae bacterium]